MQTKAVPFSSKILAALVLSACASWTAAAEAPPVAASELGNGLYFISGGGGANSSALIGDEGVLVVDSKLDIASADAEIAVIKGLTPGNIRFLINTHEHPDHTGGNLSYGNLGAVIIGHEDVYQILTAGQRGGPPEPLQARPSITFGNGGGLTLHFNGETLEVKHMPPAHAASNSIVHFVTANVYQMGDVFSGDRYPTMAGGTLQGFIDGVDQVLAEANASARFIPGNGPVGDRAALESYRAMLGNAQSSAAQAIKEGKSLEDFLASKPTAATDATYGDPARFLTAVYNQAKEAQ
ncbi:MAG: MBL fold metallo-hydrolase [Pseudomonadales bacterium]|jgi:glyoxylase-like metal-dependent hydrolase (beta-lactamase superfamily II)|nr:MBL fold metallo-hydrolase [Pseudomonadales bacterium]